MEEVDQRDKEILRLINTPVIDMVVRLDTRTGVIRVFAVGGDLNSKTAKTMINAALEWVHQQEILAIKNQVEEK